MLLDEPRARARSLLRSAGFAGWAAGTLVAFELERMRTRPEALDAMRRRYKSRLGREALSILGARWSVEGPRPRPGRPTLVVANHRSALDIAVMLAVIDASMLSRGDLAEWPVLGPLARHGKTIFVDRADKGSGARAIRQIRGALRSGELVCVFPEGTTVSGDEVRPFQAGAFAAARGLDALVVPVGFAYEPGSEFTQPSFPAHVADLARRPSTSLHVCFGEPEALDFGTEHATRHFRDRVQGLVDLARTRLDGPRRETS